MKHSFCYLFLAVLLSPSISAGPLAADVSSAAIPSAEIPSAEALLDASIAYHDPDGRFLSQAHRLVFRDERPGKTDRHAEVLIDVPGKRFEMLHRTEVEIRGKLAPGHCTMALDGRTEVTEEERTTHRLTCDRLSLLRNYYVYLWGLPMKLRDPGTRLAEPTEETFDSQPVYAMEVTYDAAVGSDIWTFYFHRDTSALVGYRFYRDATRTTGEYIYLEGEHVWGGVRLPKSRAWYDVEGDRFLGTDHLVEMGLASGI